MIKATEKTDKTNSTSSSPSSPASQLVEAATPKLRKFKKIPIFIVENHNDVLEFIYKCFAKRYLPFENNLMIHFDSHPDMCFPSFDSHFAYDKDELLQQLSIENWIMPTVFVGFFDKLVWVKREFAKQIPCGRHHLLVGEHENKIKIFSTLDYFITDGAFCLLENLEKKKSCTLDVMELNGPTALASLFSSDRFENDPTFSYVLDIDLDYFSTKNPFLSLYEKADLYNKLKAIYITEKAEDYDVKNAESIARFVNKRNVQLDKLEEIFQHMESDESLDDFLAEDEHQRGLVEQVKSLADCLKTHYPDVLFDWAVIHAAGCTCDLEGTELPHHISTDAEIEESLKQFRTFLKQLTTKLPTVVTISRSSEDDYTPQNQVDYIERSVVAVLQAVFHENITQEPIFYYKNEEYQFEGL